MSAIDSLLEANERYAAGRTPAELPANPSKKIVIVACMDARIVMTTLGLEQGDAHILRNAGGIVTEDMIRSIAISQWLMGTREIMIVQHTGCGMQTFADSELKDEIEKDTGVRPRFAIGAFSNLEDSVRRSIERVRESPFVKHKDIVRGFIYEIESSRMREVE
jgi:carbonic anhydrase